MTPTTTKTATATEDAALNAAARPARWTVLIAAIGMQLALGAIYCWPLFGHALSVAMNLSPGQTAAPFEVALGVIFLGTWVGGRLQDKYGPRPAVLLGGTLYAVGTLIASVAHSPGDLWIVIVGYGVLGGFGCGVAYVVPAALLQRWFPGRATLATALAVAGFGAGGVVTAVIAGPLLQDHPSRPAIAFVPLGIGYLGCALLAGAFFEVPPPTSTPDTHHLDGLTLREALHRPQWWLLAATLTVNVAASVGFIGTAAGGGAAIAHLTPAQTATLISFISLGNGAGRVLWAAAAERVGHTLILATLLVVQTVCLALLTAAHTAALFCLYAVGIGLCCGGGFGVMPGTVGKLFGLRHLGQIYGLLLAGWSIGGVLGPWMVSALVTTSPTHGYRDAYLALATLAAASVVLPLAARPIRARRPHHHTLMPTRQPSWSSSGHSR